MQVRDVAGKAHRLAQRTRTRLAARRPARPQTVHPATGLPYTRVRHAQDTTSLRRQMARARWTASPRNPELLLLAPGTYAGPLTAVDGLDVINPTHDPADVTLTSAGDRDTVLLSGASSLWGWLTVAHLGRRYAYALHFDGPNADAQAVLVGVRAHADTKGALGVGLSGGQGLWAYGCTFTHGAPWATGPAAVFTHNWTDQHAPTVLAFDDCTAVATHHGHGFAFYDLGSQQPDRVLWSGGHMHGLEGASAVSTLGDGVVVDLTGAGDPTSPRRRPRVGL